MVRRFVVSAVVLVGVAAFVALVGLTGLLGCGYNLVGRGTALPSHVKKVSIPVFKNQTLEAGLEAIVTDGVVASFMKRGGLEIGDASADARLLGVVVRYELKRLGYDTQGVPNEYRVAIVANVQLVDLTEDEVIFPAKEFSIEKDYRVKKDISDIYPTERDADSRDISTREQSRQKALEMAAADLGKEVVSAILDKF
ncbi:MAG: LptE family protein [Candidatus Coatesbacteria bacterium]|nr:LptE family protein [Candidatus Coatesbacteria bacterium]